MGSSANPYDPGNAVMPKYFAGREEQIREIRHCFESCQAGHPTHVFIPGEWGIGKTSLLLRLHPELEEHGTVIRESVPLGPDQGPQFYQAVFAGLYPKTSDVMRPEEVVALTQSFRSARGIREGLQAMMAAVQAADRAPVVLILDELERAQPEFLSELRDIFQRLGQDGIRYMLLFAGKELPVPTSDAADPVRRFFQLVPVERMSETESLDAIRRPIQFIPDFTIKEDAGRLIFQRTSGHPYFLKKICHEIFNLADGQGSIDPGWLIEHWVGIEGRLARDKFQSEVDGLPENERNTILRASLLEERFQARTLREELNKPPDVALLRLSERGLLRRPSRGTYEIYHPLFRNYLRSLAGQAEISVRKHHDYVPEGRPVLGRQTLEELLTDAAEKWLDILDQHFRERAVALLEVVRDGVQIRILMGEDKAWSKTKRYLDDLPGGLRKRIEIRAWIASNDRPFPAHVRMVLGDRRCWESSHSLGAVGQKATTFTDKSTERKKLRSEFNRWWKDSTTVYPVVSEV
jgi:hypothetical protein